MKNRKIKFLPYKEAFDLKELGFFEHTLYSFFPNPNKNLGEEFSLVNSDTTLPNQIKSIGDLINEGVFQNAIFAPLYQEAFEWFLEKYNLDANVSVDVWNTKKCEWRITGGIKDIIVAGANNELYDYESENKYDTYQEAQLECIRELIKIVKQNLIVL